MREGGRLVALKPQKPLPVSNMSAASGLLFAGKTAWFAVDVRNEVKHLWFVNGGELETAGKADYMFSERYEDEELRQTRRGGKYPAAVFQPDYIEAVCASKSLTSVPIGRFLLLPIALQSASHFPLSLCRSVMRVGHSSSP